RPVSAVGAGDSFLGALTYGLASGARLDDAFRLAVAAGAAALLNPGTELCRPCDVKRLAGGNRKARIEPVKRKQQAAHPFERGEPICYAAEVIDKPIEGPWTSVKAA